MSQPTFLGVGASFFPQQVFRTKKMFLVTEFRNFSLEVPPSFLLLSGSLGRKVWVQKRYWFRLGNFPLPSPPLTACNMGEVQPHLKNLIWIIHISQGAINIQ
jgi:hypothetical protein